MQAVAAIHERILQIQSHIAQLAPPRVPGAALGATGSAAATSGTAGTSAAAATRGAAFAQTLASVEQGSVVGSGRARLNADGVPVDLAGYGNGKLPAEALSTIGSSGHRLWTPAARSFEALQQAAARDGVSISVTDSYRTYESQVDLAARKGLYSQGGLAATPGTSDHGWGMALDLGLDSRALAWMREHAGEYGFAEDTPRETWHWGYHPTH